MAPETHGLLNGGSGGGGKPASNSGEVSRQSSLNGGTGTGLEGEIRRLALPEPVGISHLPDQYVNRAIKHGFIFNVMIVGGTGIGKSTLVDSLFNQRFTDVSNKSHQLTVVEVHKQSHELVEKTVKLKLSIIETKGFGDQINKSESHTPIVSYLDQQFETYLQKELEVSRNANAGGIDDSRVHACIYTFSPNGPGMQAVDLITLRELDNRVNVIPVIARADTLTATELKRLKTRIMSELVDNGINIYTFPVDDSTVADVNSAFNNLLPFAVVGSRDFVRVGSKNLRARQYPWGTVQVDREGHCDFAKLRDAVMRYNLEDLRESTHTRHYEVYRMRRLSQMGFGGAVGELASAKTTSFQETFEARRAAHQEDMKRKEEEMRNAFVQRVKEKESELKEADRELQTKYDALRKQLAHEKANLEQEAMSMKVQMGDFEQRKQAVLGTAGSGHGGTIHTSSSSLASSLKLKYKR